jgi:hypothetical protein
MELTGHSLRVGRNSRDTRWELVDGAHGTLVESGMELTALSLRISGIELTSLSLAES